MGLLIPKNPKYAEATITFIGLSNSIYGKPQYVLVNPSDNSTTLKFPGLKYRRPREGETLEDVAVERFEQQTGLKVSKRLGLRGIIPGRSRHTNHWIFRNVFLGVVDGTSAGENDGRTVYMADAGSGVIKKGIAYELGNSQNRAIVNWSTPEDRSVAELATNCLYNFNWNRLGTTWNRKIPCIGVPSLTSRDLDDKEGCGLAVSSMMLIYKPTPEDELHVMMVKRKGDKFPGYAGGKIENPEDSSSQNLDPISCCAKEGADEFGFGIMPLGLIGVTCTPIDVFSENPESNYNSLVNYSFVARPVNPLEVKKCLENPREHLEDKMESYVSESLTEHRDRIFKKQIRMPDMVEIGKYFFEGKPGDRIPLTQIIDSGVY